VPFTLPILELEKQKRDGKEPQIGVCGLILRLVTVGVFLEILMVPAVFVASPFLVLINAYRAARAIWVTSASQTWYLLPAIGQKAFFFGKVVTVIETLVEALPELLIQVNSFLAGDLDADFSLYFSISSSAYQILMTIIAFIRERDQLRFTMIRIASRRKTDRAWDTYTNLLKHEIPNQKGELNKRPKFGDKQSVSLQDIPLGKQITLFNGLLEALEVSLF